MLQQCGGMPLERASCRAGATAGLQMANRTRHAPAAHQLASLGTSRRFRQDAISQQRCMLRIPARSRCRGAGTEEQQPGDNLPEPIAEIIQAVGEDAALFRLQDQSISAWGVFTMLLVGVLGALYAVCYDTTGRVHARTDPCLSVYRGRFQCLDPQSIV